VLLFIIILTQGVLFLYLLSHMYCNSIYTSFETKSTSKILVLSNTIYLIRQTFHQHY